MSEIVKHTIKVRELGITPSDVIRYISAGNMNGNEYFAETAGRELKKTEDEDVYFGYTVLPASLDATLLKIDRTIFNVGDDISLMLRSVDKTAVFACTLSPGLNKIIEQYSFSSDYVEAYMMDIIGTVIIEKTLVNLHKEIKDLYKTIKVTNTISPGNCGWSVEEQRKLFSLLPGGFLNIKLNHSGMMKPVKSLSGIIGIGSKVIHKQTECRYCKSRNCPYRKEEFVSA